MLYGGTEPGSLQPALILAVPRRLAEGTALLKDARRHWEGWSLRAPPPKGIAAHSQRLVSGSPPML